MILPVGFLPPISDFLKKDSDSEWSVFPNIYMKMMLPQEDHHLISYINKKDGLQVIATMLYGQNITDSDFSNLELSYSDVTDYHCIHISISPLRSLRQDLTDEQHVDLVANQSASLIDKFLETSDLQLIKEKIPFGQSVNYVYLVS